MVMVARAYSNFIDSLRSPALRGKQHRGSVRRYSEVIKLTFPYPSDGQGIINRSPEGQQYPPVETPTKPIIVSEKQGALLNSKAAEWYEMSLNAYMLGIRNNQASKCYQAYKIASKTGVLARKSSVW